MKTIQITNSETQETLLINADKFLQEKPKTNAFKVGVWNGLPQVRRVNGYNTAKKIAVRLNNSEVTLSNSRFNSVRLLAEKAGAIIEC